MATAVDPSCILRATARKSMHDRLTWPPLLWIDLPENASTSHDDPS
jgi:hypothetical protein